MEGKDSRFPECQVAILYEMWAHSNGRPFLSAGDGCYDLADAHGIELDDFYTWNPALMDDCSGL